MLLKNNWPKRDKSFLQINLVKNKKELSLQPQKFNSDEKNISAITEKKKKQTRFQRKNVNS